MLCSSRPISADILFPSKILLVILLFITHDCCQRARWNSPNSFAIILSQLCGIVFNLLYWDQSFFLMAASFWRAFSPSWWLCICQWASLQAPLPNPPPSKLFHFRRVPLTSLHIPRFIFLSAHSAPVVSLLSFLIKRTVDNFRYRMFQMPLKSACLWSPEVTFQHLLCFRYQMFPLLLVLVNQKWHFNAF